MKVLPIVCFLLAAPALAEVGINPRLLRRFKPVAGAEVLPPPPPALVALGRQLWYDARLSKAQDISCNTCHDLARYGVDGKATSIGHRQQRGERNAPTVYNAAEHFAFFWDGRAATLEQQAVMPMMNPAEMGMSDTGVVAVVASIPAYAKAFEQAFPNDAPAVSLAHIGKALVAFERGLVTPSRWDRFLAGEQKALTAPEQEGLRVFLDVGCMACHTGPQVGASMFQKVGAVEPWPNGKDLGRYVITGQPADKWVFKVPTLKNIAKTAPYFHDGSGADLKTAVHLMGKHQLGIDLSDEEVASIVTFLGALTGELPTSYIAKPSLPPSGPQTPKPDKT